MSIENTASFAMAVLSIAISLRASAMGAGSELVVRREVIALERAWSEAEIRHDLDTISKILADDFVGIDGRGMVSDKAAELEEARAPASGSVGPVLLSEELSDIRVRVYGDTAILTATNSARFRSKGTESTVRYRRTTVYLRRHGQWQCVSFHGSRILEPVKPQGQASLTGPTAHAGNSGALSAAAQAAGATPPGQGHLALLRSPGPGLGATR